eukprot:3323141-Ditylum_brightwellii.AAC.1
MVLRDPPGGLSYATYKNIKTTIELETSSTSTTVHHHFGINFKATIDHAVDLCTGVVVGTCKEVFKFGIKYNFMDYRHDTGGIVKKSAKTRSTQFTTTWSYQTSTDPWTA